MTDQRYFVFFKPDGTPQQDMTVCVAPEGDPPSIPGTTCVELEQGVGASLPYLRLVDGEVVEMIPDAPVDDPVETSRARAKQRLQQEYAAAVAYGITWEGHRLNASPASRQAIQLYVSCALSATQAGLPFSTIEFTCADNSVASIPQDAWPVIGASLASHLNTQHVKYQNLKAMALALQSVEQLDNLKW